MTPNDPRHGQIRGYIAGCRHACCRRAMAAYEKQNRLLRLQGKTRSVAAIGTQRRIQGLMRLGWTAAEIATEAGWSHRNAVLRILNGQKGRPTTRIEAKTHRAIDDVFKRLCMQIPPPNIYRRRNINMAIARGYAPPLAWDNIDDADEKPVVSPSRKRRGVDEAAVDRVLAGDPTVRTTEDERYVITARWIAAGKSEKSLCDMTGWRPGRYTPKGAAA